MRPPQWGLTPCSTLNFVHMAIGVLVRPSDIIKLAQTIDSGVPCFDELVVEVLEGMRVTFTPVARGEKLQQILQNLAHSYRLLRHVELTIGAIAHVSNVKPFQPLPNFAAYRLSVLVGD